jgi:hypothetical protein
MLEQEPMLAPHILADRLRNELSNERLVGFVFEQIERIITVERRRIAREAETRAVAGQTRDTDAGPNIVDQLLEEYRREVIIDWTAELLGTEFALGDGTAVTWAQATVVQHRIRIALLTRNVRGNLDTIQRHEAAIAAITVHGAARLAEVAQ